MLQGLCCCPYALSRIGVPRALQGQVTSFSVATTSTPSTSPPTRTLVSACRPAKSDVKRREKLLRLARDKAVVNYRVELAKTHRQLDNLAGLYATEKKRRSNLLD